MAWVAGGMPASRYGKMSTMKRGGTVKKKGRAVKLHKGERAVKYRKKGGR